MPSRLTFGVEFEFALALLPEGKDDPEPELPQQPTVVPPNSKPDLANDSWNYATMNAVFGMVATKLREAGLPARSIPLEAFEDDTPARDPSQWATNAQADGYGWIEYRKPAPTDDETEDETDDQKSAGSAASTALPDGEFDHRWMVTQDTSIKATRPYDYSWFQIEVQSPPYIFCENSLEAVRLACNVLTRELRVETNATTGVHVHVGDGSDGYFLQTVKKLMAFLWAFEPQLDQIHPNRIPGVVRGELATWYESLRRGSNLSHKTRADGRGRLTVLEGLKFIYEHDSIEGLYAEMKPQDHKSAYEIRHLANSVISDSIKKTIEFRQHEGTMDGNRVVEWIKTVVALMEWIEGVETLPLMDFLMEAAMFEDRCWPATEQEPYDIIDLFNDIGLVEQAKYWDGAIPKNARMQPTKYYAHPRRQSARRAAGRNRTRYDDRPS